MWKATVNNTDNIDKLWRKVKQLKNAQPPPAMDKVLKYKGKECVNNSANAFIDEFASTSKLKIPKPDRWVRR